MSVVPGPYNITSTFLRLRSDVTIEPIPVEDNFWQTLAQGGYGNFHNEYLVTCHAFDRDWSSWEMHPNGDELVCLLEGAVTFMLEETGGNRALELGQSGDYLIVPKGVWHTARVRGPSRVLFITAGEGTRHREAS